MMHERPGGKRAGDPEVDRAWRSASNEEPAPQLDATILSAARSRRPRLQAWQPLAAVATVAALAFLLVPLMPRERNVEAPITVETAPATAGVREEAKASVEAVAPSALPAAPPDEQQARDAAGAPEAPSAPAAFSAEATAGNAMRGEAAPEPGAQMSPEQWSARIDTLYRSGDTDAAELQLRAFREAHADADHYLPQQLRDWASAIK